MFYCVISAANDLSKARISGKIADQVYQKGYVDLSEESFKGLKVQLGGKELTIGKDYYFEAIDANALKKGTARVTIKGLDSAGYGGEKTVRFRITAKSVSWKRDGKAWVMGQWSDF